MKSILLHIYDDPAQESRLQFALDLAREFGGHITCLQAVSYEMAAAGNVFASTAAEALPVVRENADRHRKAIEDDLRNEGVPFEWILEHGMSERRMLQHAVMHDIVVVSPLDVSGAAGRVSHLVGLLALEADTPVMVVPTEAKGFDCDLPAMLAWNGSAEAANAMRAAVPLFARATQVFVATVGDADRDEDEDFSGSRAAAYLSRHGIHAEVLELPDSKGNVADALNEAATARGAAYLVMGAYGRSRLREMFFGGVTRDMLQATRIPLLLTH